MGETTAIGWTDHTFNPWWGCERVSPGCQNCYAETFAKRTGNDVWGKRAERRLFGDKHWNEPMKWDRAAAKAGIPARVFCASMADVFEDRRDLDEQRDRLWTLIQDTPHLRWQLLTKRPQNVIPLSPWAVLPENVWIGTTVEDQARADERVPILLTIPAKVHFLSCEPLLGPVYLKAHWLKPTFPGWAVEWVIVGGESGPRHRPLDINNARDLKLQCVTYGVPFFFKQHGGRTAAAGGCLLDGQEWKQFPETAAA